MYVNDSFAVEDEEALEDTIKRLQDDFSLVINREAYEYLGCKIENTKDGVTVLSQPDILKRMRMRFWDKIKDVAVHSTPSTLNYKAYKVKQD